MESFWNKDGMVVVMDMIDVIQQNKQYLSDIDGAIGDGDHGVNMNKGFTLCKERMEGQELTLAESFDTLGMILLSEIGGSMGPIYGSFFLGMAESVEDKEQIDTAAFGEMLQAGLDGITDIVDSNVGDKTLLDCLVPAVETYHASSAAGKPFGEALDDMEAAAEKGKESTKDMVAKVGRASRLGERSRGVLDAGATSCNLLLTSMAGSVKRLFQ